MNTDGDDAFDPAVACRTFSALSPSEWRRSETPLVAIIPAGRQEPQWHLCPTAADELPTRMRYYGANHTQEFLARGFVIETAHSQSVTNRIEGSSLGKRAWGVFLVNAVVMDVVAFAR